MRGRKTTKSPKGEQRGDQQDVSSEKRTLLYSPGSPPCPSTLPQPLGTHLLTPCYLGWEEAEPGTPGTSGQLWAEMGEAGGIAGVQAVKSGGVVWVGAETRGNQGYF